MANGTFEKVWYLPAPNEWGDMKLVAFRDVGTLVVNEDSLEFSGRKERLRIADVQRISYGKQGRDFINNWVKIEYENGKTAFFADGSMLGWGGILGGTMKIFNAIQHLQRNAEARTK